MLYIIVVVGLCMCEALRLNMQMNAGSSFGSNFRVTTFGESHGKGIGVVVDGCPPGISIHRDTIQRELSRRRPGQSIITSPRNENDQVEIWSGINDESVTLGTPIGMTVRNLDQRSQDYDNIRKAYRPSHADATYDAKYGIQAGSGGGRSSARETIGRVAAGSIAKQILRKFSNVEILAYVVSIHSISWNSEPYRSSISFDQIEASEVRCPDPSFSKIMVDRIMEMRDQGNSLGGVIEVLVRNFPSGYGSPVFDRLEADLAKACISIPAAKAFEIGSGFAGCASTGKDQNDAFFRDENGRIRTKSNNSGGIQGGISNGEDIIFRVGFKPTSTISIPQASVTPDGQETQLQCRGRHDPCVLPRAVPIVEAMTSIVLVNSIMQQAAQRNVFIATPSILGKAHQFEEQ